MTSTWHPFLIARVVLANNTQGPIYGKALIVMDGVTPKTLGKFHPDEPINRGAVYNVVRQHCGDLDPTAIIYDLFPDREGWEQFFLTMAQKGLLEAASHERRHIYNATTGCCAICEQPWAPIEHGTMSRWCPGEPLPF